ncbi:MAG: hypothetical protein HY270_17860 [Deltaproteobacteria bacterium]|nr:hypothetical protein [Deltaproteobacteria bacterium]
MSFHVALALMITSELVDHFLEVGYHKETRGCPMDFTEDHSDLVPGLRTGRFCRPCTRRLDKNKDLKAAVEAMLAWGR